jgi:hypothetical protein
MKYLSCPQGHLAGSPLKQKELLARKIVYNPIAIGETKIKKIYSGRINYSYLMINQAREFHILENLIKFSIISKRGLSYISENSDFRHHILKNVKKMLDFTNQTPC